MRLANLVLKNCPQQNSPYILFLLLYISNVFAYKSKKGVSQNGICEFQGFVNLHLIKILLTKVLYFKVVVRKTVGLFIYFELSIYDIYGVIAIFTNLLLRKIFINLYCPTPSTTDINK